MVFMSQKEYKKIVRSLKRFLDMWKHIHEFHTCPTCMLFTLQSTPPLSPSPSTGRGKRPLLLVFSCEKWKLPQKWLQRLSQRGYVAAAVEAKPLLHAKDFGAHATAPSTTWHCNSVDVGRSLAFLGRILVDVKHELHLKWIEMVVNSGQRLGNVLIGQIWARNWGNAI